MIPISLKRLSWWTVGAFALGGLICYFFAVALDVSGSDSAGTDSYLLRVAQDLLLLTSGVLLGAGGLAGAFRVWRSRRVAHRTGGALLALLTELDGLGAHLNALVWDPCRGMLAPHEDLDSDTVWNLMGGSYEAELPHRHASMLSAVLANTPAAADAAGKGRLNAAQIAATSEKLHARARELGAYEPASSDDLVTATALLRSLGARYEAACTSGVDGGAAGVAGLAVDVASPLSALARAVAEAESATVRVLDRSERGRALLAPHLVLIKERNEDRQFAATFATQGRILQQKVDSIDQQVTDLSEEVRRLQAGDGSASK